MAIKFTGNSSTATNYMSVDNSGSPLSPTRPFSFGCFGRRQNDSNNDEHLMSSFDSGSEHFGIELTSSVSNAAKIWTPNAATKQSSTSVTVASGWTHIAATTDASGNGKIYINGVEDATFTWAAEGGSHNLDVFLGIDSNASGSQPGDDVEACEWFIYDRELSAGEAAAIGKGYSAAFIQNGLLMYVPGLDASGYEATGRTVTVTGSLTVVDHPRIIRPSAQILHFPPAAAGGGGGIIPQIMHHRRLTGAN